MVHKGQIILAISNPNPEIEAELALKHGAAFAADGKSVNNVWVSGHLPGAVDTWAAAHHAGDAGRSCHGDCRLYNRRPAGPQSAGQEAAIRQSRMPWPESDRTGSGALGICPYLHDYYSIRHKHMEVTQLTGFMFFLWITHMAWKAGFLHQSFNTFIPAGNSSRMVSRNFS